MKTWLVVASAARARFFEIQDPEGPWVELVDLLNAEDRLPRQAFTSDEPGRAVNSARGQHHTMQPTVDPKERAATRFAGEVIEKLQWGLDGKRFEHVILVAGPHFLGLLRQRMGLALANAVQREIDKDLTRENLAALQAHLAALP